MSYPSPQFDFFRRVAGCDVIPSGEGFRLVDGERSIPHDFASFEAAEDYAFRFRDFKEGRRMWLGAYERAPGVTVSDEIAENWKRWQ